ncbi:SusC/RagA family TonB-linked outer membrane protein [Mucilaginibacter sp. E4BP6]|uniref:SusC/RagA family TonB-linked outer membrane protein n=1 Tax=Mucilaginibacter sp. E4BP6 TaxID=2723089 RepID=UPI0018397C09|nr:TonB-dependent receptor [Mucilaginibacter sp. E4BP6]NYE66943.1 TonB-linked SusC/RagA family outer membrane protein [Mucilaginibacter sp. E4BP6]
MKKTLLKKIPIINNLRFYLGTLILLFVSGFSFAGVLNGAPNHVMCAVMANAQKVITIRGKVTELTNGQSIPGVTVTVKGSQHGTITDASGNFEIKASDDATLVFTSVGYVTVEVPVQGKTMVNVSMQVTDKSLSEVVVVAYGTQKKTSITAAVSTINTSEIESKPVVNMTNSLIGRASGIIATQGSGEPGFDGSSIQIRGAGSIGSTQPLYIVDGVPRDFSRMDPNSIATMTILKDAAAVAPYGVAGANGVILITTKQGKTGKPLLTFDGYVGFQNPTRVPTFVDSYQYATMRNEAAANDAHDQGSTYIPFATPAQLALYQNGTDPNAYPNSQPLKDIIQPNRLINYDNITLSGGTDDIKYFASIGYTHQDGMWSTSYLDRYNGVLNISAKATKTTTIALNVNSYVEDQHFPSVASGSIINQAQRQTPVYPLYYNGNLPAGFIGQSLIGDIYDSGYQLNENTALYTSLSINQELPLKGLSIKGVISYDNGPDPIFGNQTSFTRKYSTPIPFYTINTNTTPYTYSESFAGSSQAQFYESYSQNIDLDYQGLLNYSGSFGKSDITGLLVADYRDVNYENFNATRINYNLDIDELSFGGTAPADATNAGSSGGEKQLGYVYRADYAYDKKYLFEATGRYDGSYLFGPGHRFGFFPAFSAGWRLSEEKLIKDNFTWIDNLKIRASWGQSGAYPSVGGTIQTYQYLSPYSVGGGGVIGGTATQSVYQSLQGNPNITWEKSTKTDVGFEGSLWKGALGFEVDYFNDKRSNMLVSIGAVLPAEYGISTGDVNGGIMENHGIDLTLTTVKQFSKDWRLDVKATFTYAQNKLLQIYENSATYNNPNRRQTGRPLGTQFGLEAIGYFTPADFVDPNAAAPTLKPGIPIPTFGPVHPGDIQYADLNHDGKIDGNDQGVIGKPTTPEIVYGLEPRITFKHFDLDVLFQGTAASDIYLNNYFVNPFYGSGSASELSYNNTWTPTNTNALYPRLTGTPSANNTQGSSWWIRNDSYVRVKSAEFGYTFSNKLLGNTIHSLRIYLAAENLFTWTPYMKEIIDPENSSGDQNYYQQRVISIGLNASF